MYQGKNIILSICHKVLFRKNIFFGCKGTVSLQSLPFVSNQPYFHACCNTSSIYATCCVLAETAVGSYLQYFGSPPSIIVVSKYNIHDCKLAWRQTLWQLLAQAWLSVIWEGNESRKQLWICLKRLTLSLVRFIVVFPIRVRFSFILEALLEQLRQEKMKG